MTHSYARHLTTFRDWALPRWCYPHMGSVVGGGSVGRIITKQWMRIYIAQQSQESVARLRQSWIATILRRIQALLDSMQYLLLKIANRSLLYLRSFQIGTLKTIKRLQRGDVLVETDGQLYSARLQELSELVGVPVQVTPHRSLNTCKGVIRSREVAACSVEEIVRELKPQRVTDATIISVRDGSATRRTNTAILSFALSRPLQHIKAGYIRLPVELYIPNPLRCYKCQKYGHGSNTCRGFAVCIRCGATDHNDSGCNCEAKCANCGGNDMVSSKECPVWVREKKVQQIKAEQGCSFPEARRLATAV